MSLLAAVALTLAQDPIILGWMREPQIPVRKAAEEAFCAKGTGRINTITVPDVGLQVSSASWRGKKLAKHVVTKFNADPRIRTASYVTSNLCMTRRSYGADGILVSVYHVEPTGRIGIRTFELSDRGLIWRS